MTESRRHRLIWSAVASAHLVALGAVLVGGAPVGREPVREGGVLLISLISDPIALPGEVKAGVAVGAGDPVATPPKFVAAPAVSAAPSFSAATPVPPVAVESGAGQAPAAVAVPQAEVYVPPAFELRQEPAYPDRARRAGVEGQVVVKVHLSESGEVRQVELASGSGSRLLDEAALAAARASHFTPAARNGRLVPSEAVATYRFELR